MSSADNREESFGKRERVERRLLIRIIDKRIICLENPILCLEALYTFSPQ